MEFHHKPKPWHGWREFLREYAIVVVGVLTAAAVGLTVDWLHRRAEVAEARKALRSEIADNASKALVTIEQERCLGALEAQLIAAGNRGALLGARRPQRALPADIPAPVSSTWDVVKAGAAAHMPFEERVAYSRFYDSVAADLVSNHVEVEVLRRLAGWMEKAESTRADVQRVIEASAEAQLVGSFRSREALKRVNAAKAMGITPARFSAAQRADIAVFCHYYLGEPAP
jgi:hypothetical protein